MRRRPLSLLLAVCAAGCTTGSAAPLPAPSLPAGFWDHWGDGLAELNGYTLTQPRYGEVRQGEAVLIFVTEDFDDAARVKSDRGGAGTFPVLKLNTALDFETGIYDYNAMTSVFVPLDGRLPLGRPAKLSASMQEWCGHVYDQVVVRGDTAERAVHSYFEGEADQQSTLSLDPGTVFADALPIVARGLVGELPSDRPLTLAPRLLDLRMAHAPFSTQPATLTVGQPGPLTVPAGTFTVRPVEVRAGATWTRFQVEVEAPHRLIGWSRSTGEEAQLTGSMRGPYWRQHDNGQEALRADLGLPARTWPAPHPEGGG